MYRAMLSAQCRAILLIATTVILQSACVPYPHSVTRNSAIEGRVLSAETGQAVSGAKVELDIGSDDPGSTKPPAMPKAASPLPNIATIACSPCWLMGLTAGPPCPSALPVITHAIACGRALIGVRRPQSNCRT